MIDEEFAAVEIGKPRQYIMTHGMVDQQKVALGYPQILQPPQPSGQLRVYMFDENLGVEAKALHHGLDKEHAIGDGISDRRARVELMDPYLVLADHGRARPERRCVGLL